MHVLGESPGKQLQCLRIGRLSRHVRRPQQDWESQERQQGYTSDGNDTLSPQGLRGRRVRGESFSNELKDTRTICQAAY